MISNLAQMKRTLRKGTVFEMVWSEVHPENNGQTRRVNVVQTNGIYSVVDGDPDHKVSTSNNGKGYWMSFGKASQWAFADGLCVAHRRNGEPIFSIKVKEV